MNLQPMLEAVSQAMRLCVLVRNSEMFDGATKEGIYKKEPVTIADYGSQAILCRALARYFPQDGVIAEEAGSQFRELLDDAHRAFVIEMLRRVLGETISEGEVIGWLDHGRGVQSERTWVIDPIDGTKGFIAGRHYAVGLGLLLEGEARGGMIGCPTYRDSGAIFYVDDDGAYCLAYDEGRRERIHVSARSEPATMRVVQSVEREHASKWRMALLRERVGLVHVDEIDSMEKYALVAAGDADVLIRLPRGGVTQRHRIWDHVAGVALVHAAGGRATDVDGSPLRFNQGDLMPNQGMLVSNGRMHEALVEAAQAALNSSDAEADDSSDD